MDLENFKSKLFRNPQLRIDERARTPSFNCCYDRVQLDREGIEDLKSFALRSDAGSVRVNLHSDPSEAFHQMVIVHKKGHYYRPHKHLEKGEAYHLIEGKMKVYVFSDSGQVIEETELGAPQEDQDLPFIYRMDAGNWHCTVPQTDLVIFHESKPGPFIRSGDAVYPNWAPDGSDAQEAHRYIVSLLTH